MVVDEREREGERERQTKERVTCGSNLRGQLQKAIRWAEREKGEGGDDDVESPA